MINPQFEHITTLQYRLKNANNQLEAIKSGQIYSSMQAEFKKQLAKKERKIIKQSFSLSVAHSVTVRKYWSEVMDDLLKEHETELLRKDRALKSM